MRAFAAVGLLSLLCLVTAETHPCRRACPDDGSTMKCYYDFTMQWFTTMSSECGNCPFDPTDCNNPGCNSADGVPRPIISINRQVPGPAIEVCENDTVIVKVRNRLDGGEGTTIHWHGLYQVETPYMDGVPMVTQCPIPFMTDFTYKFKAWPPGTHFYHGHLGSQKADGLYGPLIIRQSPQNDFNWHEFDQDNSAHTLMATDWLHESTITKYTQHLHDQGDQKPDSILVNGKGSSAVYKSKDGDLVKTPKSVFVVDHHVRYRFRIIDAGFLTCPLVMSISGHTFRVIATDSYPIEATSPKTSLRMHSGEMYDIIIEAHQPVGNYWINFKGTQECELRKIFGQAILRYSGAPEEEPAEVVTYDDLPTGPETMDFTQFRSRLPNDATTKPNADVTIFLALDMDASTMMHGMPGMGDDDMDMDGMDHASMGHGNMDMNGGGMKKAGTDMGQRGGAADPVDVSRDDNMDGSSMDHRSMDHGHAHHQMDHRSMGNMPMSTPPPTTTMDPHAGHNMPTTADPHAGHNMNMHMDMDDDMGLDNRTMLPIGPPYLLKNAKRMYSEYTGPVSHHVHHPHINMIQYRPTSSPFLTQFYDVNQTALCNSTHKPAECTDPNEPCKCTHLHRVPLGGVVEVIMYDQGVMNDYEHAMHIHGMKFSVVASEKIADQIDAADVLNKQDFNRNLNHPPRKDVVYVPEGGYTIIRFHAVNPGFWIFHCHIQFHVESGMALVFQVGELSDMVRAPRNFPTCGSFDPEDEVADSEDGDVTDGGAEYLGSDQVQRGLADNNGGLSQEKQFH